MQCKWNFTTKPSRREYAPEVISLRALAEEYSSGFKKPRELLSAAISSSFKSATTLAKVGDEQLVPEIETVNLSKMIWKFSPCVETSGYPRPLAL